MDPKLTSLDDMTYERMLIRREDQVGKVRKFKADAQEYPGPGYEAIKSSVSFFLEPTPCLNNR